MFGVQSKGLSKSVAVLFQTDCAKAGLLDMAIARATGVRVRRRDRLENFIFEGLVGVCVYYKVIAGLCKMIVNTAVAIFSITPFLLQIR